jgi:hypothetical protein
MKRTLAVSVLMMFVATGLLLAGSTTEDRAGVEAAVLDYVEGVYEADPDRIRRSVHPDLKKFGFARRSPDEEYRIIPMTFDQLVELAGTYNADGKTIPPDAPKKIEILDVLDQTAAAKLTAAWGVDYFHLAKYDGRWQIVQILWQSVD